MKRITSYKWETIPGHIVQVEKTAQSLQSKIHSIAVSIMARWASHKGDGAECANRMTNLVKASPYHSKAFADWVSLKTGMMWSEEKEVFYVHKDQKCSKETLEACKAETFWEVSPPAKASPLTNEAIIGILEGIIDKQKRHDKKSVEGDNYSKAGNEHIRGAIKALREQEES